MPGRVGEATEQVEPQPQAPQCPNQPGPMLPLVAKLFVICLPGGGFWDSSFLNFETMSNLSNHV